MANEFVGRPNPKNTIYAKLMKKGKPVAPNLYHLTDKVVAAVRRSLNDRPDFFGRPEETDSFRLTPKADVTGVHSDQGWILKDKREDYIKRFSHIGESALTRGKFTLDEGILPVAEVGREGVTYTRMQVDDFYNKQRSLGLSIRDAIRGTEFALNIKNVQVDSTGRTVVHFTLV